MPMALCGISRIDDLNAGAAAASPIGPGDRDSESVGVIQNLLTGQGQTGLPNLLSPDFGSFGPQTSAAVQRFRAQHSLPAGNQVDAQMLQAMVQAPAAAPIASQGYLTLALDFDYSGLGKILSVVAQMEGAAKFSAMNLNSDKAGLSFGLIQWAQKPGRLAEILNAFYAASAADFVRILGAGDASVASGLIAHTQQPGGGIDPITGLTTDPAYDLINDPWVGRFRAAALWVPFQQVQVQAALNDFRSSLAQIEQYAPQLNTERAVGFMLDLANQFGEGGAHSIYQAAYQAGMPVSDTLQAMANESVERIQDVWKAGTQARRQHFLTTDFLSDDAFSDPPLSLQASADAAA
jgi:peptidoglycan hydrolase-like protein with peptidoglycan-binding domain